MRIIGGELGGRRIKTITAPFMRPTTDRVREAVFSSLEATEDLSEFVALDLYAGTGAMGIESLSRGVGSCIFVERDRKLCKVLRENLAELGLKGRGVVIDREMPQALDLVLDQLAQNEARRLILADPPYTEHPQASLFEALFYQGVIEGGTLLICGRPKRIEYGFPTVDYESLDLNEPSYRAKNYGDIVIDFYQF